MRLIDADELRNEVDNYDFSEYSDYSNMIDMIDDAPTIEAVPVKGDIDMTEKQHEFCRDFKALMEKYSITKAYGDYRHGVLHFVSNGLDFAVCSYFADRDLVPVDKWGMQDVAD